MSEQPQITPETKVSSLLDQYPQLEELLIEMAPAFKKLRNPILRKTIARVATLRQVAQIGDISLATLINELRAKVGQAIDFEADDQVSDWSVPPLWFDPLKMVKSLDARPIIESGQQPINLVLKELKELKAEQIYELITPFVPAPLIEMAKNQGYQAWTKQPSSKDEVKTYFTRLTELPQ